MDCTQIQPIPGHPFSMKCHIFPCFKIVTLEYSVQDFNDDSFKRIQQIARYNHRDFIDEPGIFKSF